MDLLVKTRAARRVGSLERCADDAYRTTSGADGGLLSGCIDPGCQTRHHDVPASHERDGVLSKMLNVAVEWGVLERRPCTIKLLKTVVPVMAFYEDEQYGVLVEAAKKGRPSRAGDGAAWR
jgi:hypothetical protein